MTYNELADIGDCPLNHSRVVRVRAVGPYAADLVPPFEAHGVEALLSQRLDGSQPGWAYNCQPLSGVASRVRTEADDGNLDVAHGRVIL